MSEATYKHSPQERRLLLWYLGIGFGHLFIGVLLGLFQVLQHAGIDLYKALPLVRHYYQGLTMHGVFNALVFTFFFIAAFMPFITSSGLKRPMNYRLSLVTFFVMVLGLALVDFALLSGKASVLYTSYAPLMASPPYYIGLALMVVGTLLALLDMGLQVLAWRRENPGERVPAVSFSALAGMTMWGLSTVGVVSLFVAILIPWSLGWIDGVDPLLARTLFWMTGHPLVYFWLMPVYISWYFLLPKQTGGKLFSESLARLTFLLFIPLSLPVGFHHQYLDPGVSTGYKGVHAILTFAVFMPSMITAFTVLASIEHGGRSRGGKGRFGWITKLPWGDPAVSGQLLAMVLFALGGISGLINASYGMNLLVHNTMFVPGHFHLTVGAAVAMTFMAITYWLVPYLTGRRLWSNLWGNIQAWTWFVGMAMVSRGMSWMGVLGAPRRTALGSSPYFLLEWEWPAWLSAVGGTFLTISGLFYFANMVMTLVKSPRGSAVDAQVPLAEPLLYERSLPRSLTRLAPWAISAVVLVVVTYTPTITFLLSNLKLFPGAKPF